MALHHKINSMHYRMEVERLLWSAAMRTIIPMCLMVEPNLEVDELTQDDASVLISQSVFITC